MKNDQKYPVTLEIHNSNKIQESNYKSQRKLKYLGLNNIGSAT